MKSKPHLNIYLHHLWQKRHLIFFFSYFSLLKDFRKTWLGPFWFWMKGAIPTICGLYLVSRTITNQTEATPQLILLVAGLIPWLLFASTIMWSIRSLELTRRHWEMYSFPKLLLPLSFSAHGIVDCSVAILVYMVALCYFSFTGYNLFLPNVAAFIPLLNVYLLALAIGYLLAPLAIYTRDIRFSLNFILVVVLFYSPVFFAAEYLEQRFPAFCSLNPLFQSIKFFKNLWLGGQTQSISQSLRLTLACFVMLIIAMVWFYLKESRLDKK